MDIKIQLLVILFSFIYGIFYYYITYLNKIIIFKKPLIIQMFITFLLVFNSVLLYMIILFKINSAQYHIYFLLCVISGYILGDFLSKKYVKDKKKY